MINCNELLVWLYIGDVQKPGKRIVRIAESESNINKYN